MKLSQNLINYLLLHTKNYFEHADELSRLEKIHGHPSWFLIIDMWVTPILLVFKMFITHSAPNALSLLSMYKCIRTWFDYYRYKQLRDDCVRWKLIVDSFGGPFIATNDMQYLPYVYADGMQRIHNMIFRRRTSYTAYPSHSSSHQQLHLPAL
jgi:hypothetical protein